jgi:putative DNA primase/helicase
MPHDHGPAPPWAQKRERRRVGSATADLDKGNNQSASCTTTEGDSPVPATGEIEHGDPELASIDWPPPGHAERLAEIHQDTDRRIKKLLGRLAPEAQAEAELLGLDITYRALLQASMERGAAAQVLRLRTYAMAQAGDIMPTAAPDEAEVERELSAEEKVVLTQIEAVLSGEVAVAQLPAWKRSREEQEAMRRASTPARPAPKAPWTPGSEPSQAPRALPPAPPTTPAIFRANPAEPAPPTQSKRRAKPPKPAPVSIGKVTSPAFSDDALALEFTRRHGNTLRYVHQWGKWLQWNGERWNFETTLSAFDLARAICREQANACNDEHNENIASASTVSAVERLARSDRQHAAGTDGWDIDPWLLNTPGGIADLKSGFMLNHDPDEYLTKITAVAPDPDCGIPLWRKFLEEVTGGDAEFQRFLQRMAGYALTGLIKEHAWFFFHGPGGNGKGVFIDTVSLILGDYATIAPIETFIVTQGSQHPTDLASFRGARLVTAQETEKGQQWAESKIKMLTGGSPITARFMRQDFFTYMPQFKLWIAGNHKPSIGGVDQAHRRRSNLLPFMAKIANPDKDLPEKLRAEWPGILQWAIEGCLEWQRLKGLAQPRAVLDATDEYLDDQDVIGRWIDDCCKLAPNNWQSSADLWSSFERWADRNNERLGTQKAFSAALGLRDGITGGEAARVNRVRGFSGIALTVASPSRTAPVAQPDAGACEPDYDPADYAR